MEPCCEKQENRETVERRGDLTVQKCRVCGRRHFELVIDPAVLGVKLSA